MDNASHGRSAAGKLVVMMVLAACAFPAGAPVAEEDPNASAEHPVDGVATWRVVWDNDVVLNSDNQYSNGWSLQLHGHPAESWDEAKGTPAFGKAMARWFLPDDREGLYFR